MKKISALILSATLLLPLSAAHADDAALAARTYLVSRFLSSAGCPILDPACGGIAAAIARTPTFAPTSTPGTLLQSSYFFLHSCVGQSCRQRPQMGVIRAAPPPPANTSLLHDLPTLFTLNSLFSDSSGGLLTPGKASLGNVIVLYQLFMAHGSSNIMY